MLKVILRLRHAQVIHMLDRACTLSSESPKAHRESLKRRTRGVAVVIGISLSLGVSPADGGSIDLIKPKDYIKLHYDKKQSNCLIKLYSKESAFNSKAIGNEDGIKKAYGIPQIKSEYVKDLSPNKQIDVGMRYIKHRYAGLPCYAWAHSKRWGWY